MFFPGFLAAVFEHIMIVVDLRGPRIILEHLIPIEDDDGGPTQDTISVLRWMITPLPGT